MRTLASKNLRGFLLFTTIILLCCAPLLFFLMKSFYAEELDEQLADYEAGFILDHLPRLKQSDIELWNTYNQDEQILPYDKSYSLNTPVQQSYFNKAEGHDINYRVRYTEIQIGGRPYILMCRILMLEDHDIIWPIAALYGLLVLILLIFLTVLQRLLSKKLWTPFYRTLDKVEHFNLESGTVPEFDKTDIIEFNRLNDRLNDLITDNLSIYKRQKEFIENASHELQTPLAVFQSQLDMLLQQLDLSQSQTEIIQSLYSVSSRMTRLNKNLLLLARIDNDQFVKMEDIDFVQAFYSQFLYLGELAESNGIKVNVHIDNPLKVRANKILIESLINNLVVNAIRHNIENGMINIRVKGKTVEVSNTGDPRPLDPDKIFRRFSRTSEEKKGNGLGLSIIYQICQFHHWQVTYAYTNNSYHVFTVSFTHGITGEN
jgi:signal transduction histidine kinase